MTLVLELVRTCNLEEIYKKFKPQEVVKNISFKAAMLLAHKFLFNHARDDNLREYAVSLLEVVRQVHPKEWGKDWRNEVFLGDAYYMIMKYEERYNAYTRASKNITPLPPALLVSLAGGYLSFDAPITLDDAEKLVLKALEKEKSIEAATLIRGIYKTKGDIDKFTYWDKTLCELEKKNAYMKDKWPSFFKDN